jgi:PTH1 family peptidyl-tRNA hydrolase
VLNDFAKAERGWVDAVVDACAGHAELLAAGDDANFQNRLHLALDAAGFANPKRPGRPED